MQRLKSSNKHGDYLNNTDIYWFYAQRHLAQSTCVSSTSKAIANCHYLRTCSCVLPPLTKKWDMTKLSDIQVKHMLETKILTRQVLERFAKWDEENRVSRQQFESAYLNVFGTTTSTLQGNLDLVVDNCCNKRYAWKVDCNLMVEAFLGWFLIDKPARTWSRLAIV